MSEKVYDKHGNLPSHEGDNVLSPFRGGQHEEIASEIITTEAKAEKAGVKSSPKVRNSPIPGLDCPPKNALAHESFDIQVLFKDQNGKEVNHNPETLEVRIEENGKQ